MSVLSICNITLHKPLPSTETLISRNAKEVSEISQVYLGGWGGWGCRDENYNQGGLENHKKR